MRGAVAILLVFVCSLVAAGVASSDTDGPGQPAPRPKGLAAVKHVFTIVLENKDYDATFGEDAEAPYLANTLAAKGALLTQYHGTGHFSLGNYITMISGQSENPTTQADCTNFDELTPGTIGPSGQAIGAGCVYPKAVETVAGQLEAAGRTWRGYMQDMGADPTRDNGTNCAHPEIGTADPTQKAAPNDQYATRHNPFMYFHSIIDDAASCSQHVVNLDRLKKDLKKKPRKVPNYAFITPDLCADGHDETCADPSQPGGYAGIDHFLQQYVPMILKSKSFKRNGLLVITFDESESDGSACCFVPTGPNTPTQGVYGPGGGLTGAVLISPFIPKHTVSDLPYNHYDYLHTIEDIFGLKYLGYAHNSAVHSFDSKLFSRKPK
jgi:phosphatidylinositol-3-phosphatase